MPVPSLVCLQRSGQDGIRTDPSVNPWQPLSPVSWHCSVLCRTCTIRSAGVLDVLEQILRPNCNWTSAHFGITCDGREERKNDGEKSRIMKNRRPHDAKKRQIIATHVIVCFHFPSFGSFFSSSKMAFWEFELKRKRMMEEWQTKKYDRSSFDSA